MRRIRLAAPIALVLTFLLACQDDLRLRGPKPEEQSTTLSPEDLPVFDAVFHHLQLEKMKNTGKYLLLFDRTVRFCSTPIPFRDSFCLPDDLMRRATSSDSIKVELESQLTHAFSSRNQRFAPIPSAPQAFPVRLVSPDQVHRILDAGFWREFYHFYPDAGGFAYFSLPSYTTEMDFCLVYLSMASGGLQGVEYLFWLTQTHHQWTVVKEQIISLS